MVVFFDVSSGYQRRGIPFCAPRAFELRFVRHDLTIMTRPRKVFKPRDEKVHFSMILY